MAEPVNKLAHYQGCTNWHTWVVVRCLAVIELADAVERSNPDELRWIAHHHTPAVRTGAHLDLVDWDDVWDNLKGG